MPYATSQAKGAIPLAMLLLSCTTFAATNTANSALQLSPDEVLDVRSDYLGLMKHLF